MKIFYYPFQPRSYSEIQKSFLLGNIFIYPTETLYALGCLASLEASVQKIYSLKKRDFHKPLLVLIRDWDMLQEYAVFPRATHRKILDQYWPGPLTAILHHKRKLAPKLNQHSDTLAFRMSSSPIVQELIRMTGQPLVGTSANLSGKTPVQNIEDIRAMFGEGIDGLILSEKKMSGEASTIVDMSSKEMKIVRQGKLNVSNNPESVLRHLSASG